MKVSTQNSFIILWGCLCTGILFCLAVLNSIPKEIPAFSWVLPEISKEEQTLLNHSGSGTIQEAVSGEVAYMIRLVEHSEKGLLFAEYTYQHTDNAEVRFLAESLTRRLRYTSLQVRKWLLEWYGVTTPPVLSSSLTLPDKNALSTMHTEFFAFMMRHNAWEAALTRLAVTRGLRQELAAFVIKNSHAARIELDVLRHLSIIE